MQMPWNSDPLLGSNAGRTLELRTGVREKLMAFLQGSRQEALARMRLDERIR